MNRKFLFLQGNSSHFFLALGKALDDRGHDVFRINMSGGDWYFWGNWKAVDFKGAPEQFGGFVSDHVSANGITDIVLHNDCRPSHRSAIEAVRELGCRVWVFEEGYMRPHWLTLEEGGINGHSPLMRNMATHLESANDNAGEETDFVSLPSGMKRRVIYDFQWQIWNYLLWARYPRFRTHRPFPIWAEYATWIKRLAVLPVRRRQAEKVVSRLASGEDGYFVFPMQLDTDSQVKVHSPFSGMTEALEAVIGSFARHARETDRLIVKAHPLDNGWVNFRRRTKAIAQRHGVRGRVEYIDGGDLQLLLRHAQGAVILNSTVGLTALDSGCPLICLGKAIFDLPGLTFKGELEAFWRSPEPPERTLFCSFLRYLRRESLINGDYYTDQGMGLAVRNAIARFDLPQRNDEPNFPVVERQANGAELEVAGVSIREVARNRSEERHEVRLGLTPSSSR